MFTRILLSLALVTSLVIAPTHTAHAEECSTDSCISVTADDESDEIVVSFRKPESKKASERSREVPRVSGSLSAIADPKRTWIPYHPDLYAAWREAARKAAATRAERRRLTPVRSQSQVVTASLTDRVSQLVPFGSLQTQPAQGAVIGRPVYFWSPTPTSFDVTIRVAGIPVRLELTPSFEWGYGDRPIETTRTTSLPGAPYPAPLNTFTYFEPGDKRISLTTTWSGDFTVAGVKAPINGKITQRSSKVLDVRQAPHRILD
jgi:hypothetical protein